MVYKVTFEADVNGIASVKRIDGVMYVYSKDASSARHFMEGYITSAYSETFAIISVEPFPVFELPEA
jgi:hypothetical protein